MAGKKPADICKSLLFHNFLRHGGPPPKIIHQSGLTTGITSVHGEPKFTEGQLPVFTSLLTVKTTATKCNCFTPFATYLRFAHFFFVGMGMWGHIVHHVYNFCKNAVVSGIHLIKSCWEAKSALQSTEAHIIKGQVNEALTITTVLCNG